MKKSPEDNGDSGFRSEKVNLTERGTIEIWESIRGEDESRRRGRSGRSGRRDIR